MRLGGLPIAQNAIHQNLPIRHSLLPDQSGSEHVRDREIIGMFFLGRLPLGVGLGIAGLSLSLTLWVCSLSGMRPSPLSGGPYVGALSPMQWNPRVSAGFVKRTGDRAVDVTAPFWPEAP